MGGRLIDADAYAAEMKQRQDACKEIMDAAKEEDNWELYAHMSAKFSIFVEAKLTLDAVPTVDAVPVDFINQKIVELQSCANQHFNDGHEILATCVLETIRLLGSFLKEWRAISVPILR